EHGGVVRVVEHRGVGARGGDGRERGAAGAAPAEAGVERGLDLPLARAGANTWRGLAERIGGDTCGLPEQRDLVRVLEEPHVVQDRAGVDEGARPAALSLPAALRADQARAHERLDVVAAGAEAEVHGAGL